jgi:uncharacterized protein CbrC (UPF0167 family)
MTITFAQLGIPFPLFEAPADEASEYRGVAKCHLCRRDGQHCFQLDIDGGGALILPCPHCAVLNGLDAKAREACPCRACGARTSFPDLTDGEQLLVCYTCLRQGKAAMTKDTELGMISWEQALEGVTHGIPGLSRTDFELVPREGGWIGARLPKEMMLELLRTPTYISIQGDRWQFCCRRPMIFVGTWGNDDFARNAPDGDGRRLFDEIVRDPLPGLWDDTPHDITGIYVFRCSACQNLKSYWDIA